MTPTSDPFVPTHAVIVMAPGQNEVYGFGPTTDEAARQLADEWDTPYPRVAVRVLTPVVVDPSRPPFAAVPSRN